jgi:hypothetical protein
MFVAEAYLGNNVDGVEVWRGVPALAQGTSTTVQVESVAPPEYSTLLVGDWDLNGNGFKGVLRIVGVDSQGNLNATAYGDKIIGFWDEEAKAIRFERLMDPQDASRYQFYTGYMFSNPGGQFTLAGTFEGFAGSGATAERSRWAWKAQIQIVM